MIGTRTMRNAIGAGMTGVLAASLVTIIAGTGPANASGTTVETVSQANTMVSARCYREVRTEVRYYTHSSTRGWVRLPAPTRTVSVSTHCYAA